MAAAVPVKVGVQEETVPSRVCMSVMLVHRVEGEVVQGVAHPVHYILIHGRDDRRCLGGIDEHALDYLYLTGSRIPEGLLFGCVEIGEDIDGHIGGIGEVERLFSFYL